MTRADAHEFSGLKGQFFAWFLTSPFRRLLEWKMGRPEARLLELMQLDGSQTVLDAGSGSGFHTLMLAQLLPQGRVVAVDVSPEMLDRLRRRAGAAGLTERLQVVHGDILALPHPDATFDRAISAAVWHHLDDPQAAAIEVARTLRPGGRFVVSDLAVEAGTKAVTGLAGHDVAFGVEDMRRTLLGAGLVDVQVERVGQWVIGAARKPTDEEVA